MVELNSLLENGSLLAAKLFEKNQGYGDSVEKTGEIMKILYPDGIPLKKIDDALTLVRMLDKISRLTTLDKENSIMQYLDAWFDLAGYSLLKFTINFEENQE